MAEFFHMGGYALYVWTSYALAVVVLVLNFTIPRNRHRRILADIARRIRRERSGQ